jgi:transposase
MRRLREKVRRRRPELWREHTWLLHYYNAPAHTSILAQQFLAKYKMAVIPYPQYSPDLAPCDFFLFPKMKLKLKGRRFDTTEEIHAKSPRVLARH